MPHYKRTRNQYARETAMISLNSLGVFAYLKIQPNETRNPAKEKLSLVPIT
jgi:hypothetical protein